MLHTTDEQPKNRFRLILAGGCLLAAAAGYVNVVVISAGGPAVTHVTGSLSIISSDVGHSVPESALMIFAIVVSFFIGATGSGMLVGDQTLHLGRPYGIAILIEGVLLALAGLVLPSSLVGGACLAATAAGLQNAFASAYRGLIVRTTHTTGILTDLGFLLGARLRSHPVAGWRFAFLGGLLGSFVAGGITGAVAWDTLGHNSLFVIAAPMIAGGSAYLFWRITRFERAA